MATTNETMKVIAEGIDQKKSSDIIMDGRVIVIEIMLIHLQCKIMIN